jgi:Ca2+-binding EF-hand superfamily protein
MKRIALLLLVVASACKTDNAPQPAPVAADPIPVAKRAAPPMPKLAEQAPLGSDTPDDEGRHHGDRMARMDTDGDGKISDEEREAAMKERTAKMRARLDTNGDGKLTPDELANAKGRMKFDDPAALDTNKDGDISADELEAGMKARRDEMRQQRIQGRDPTGAFPPATPPATGQ